MRGGFTLVELLIVVTVLAVALLSMSQSLVASMRLSGVNRETALATDGVRATIELLEGAQNFSQVFALYDGNPANDPGVAGTAPGAAFDVHGLSAVDGDPDGRVGEIVFPVVGNELRENLVDASLGMPRDLNGDGVIDAANHAGDYKLLPVLLRLRWKVGGSARSLEVRTLLANR